MQWHFNTDCIQLEVIRRNLLPLWIGRICKWCKNDQNKQINDMFMNGICHRQNGNDLIIMNTFSPVNKMFENSLNTLLCEAALIFTIYCICKQTYIYIYISFYLDDCTSDFKMQNSRCISVQWTWREESVMRCLKCIY